MTPRRRPRRERLPRELFVGPREWIGGLLSPPFFLEGREEPYRPGWVLWLEGPLGLAIGQKMIDPEDAAGAVGRVLRSTLERPLIGPRRRPDAVRVADETLVPEVREALGDGVPIEVAPTPELDAFLDEMLEAMEGSDAEESYLEGGRIAPEAVAGLFATARVLYGMAPWEVATDDQVLRMDIPSLGVEGACLSIIGNLGESLGLLVFPSLAGYEAFLAAADGPPSKGRRIDLGTDWLALNFEREADLPASLRREVVQHGWPVAAAEACPRVERRDRDGASRPLVARDIEVATACAAAFAAFFSRHRELFEAEEIDAVCESWFDEKGLEVRFTLPYQAFPQFDLDVVVEEGPPATGRIQGRAGRNDPCPCGSGRKYKKCCLARDEEVRAVGRERDRAEAVHPGHELDRRLLRKLSDFARAELDAERVVPPELRNTDGDPFLLTTDHFEIAPGQQPAVEAALAALEGVEPPENGEEPVYSFVRPGNALHKSWDNTVIGHARISGTALLLETNSRERADALRARVEAACGEQIRHRAREHADPLSPRAAPAHRRTPPEPSGPEVEELLREWKRRYYTDWLDEALPALGGKTPREAARTAQGRNAVDVLLKDMENHEQRSAPGAAFDFSELRRALRLE